jgi:hypothetical protein
VGVVKRECGWVKEVEWSQAAGGAWLTNVSLEAGGGDVRDFKQPVHVPRV